MTENTWQLDVSPLSVDANLTLFCCTEGNSIALEDPYFYLKYHLHILPPLVTWAAMVLYMRRDGVCHSQSRCISQILGSVKGGGWDSKLL